MYERNRMYFERFKLLQILVPPLSEQHNISNWIEENTDEINRTIIRVEREIDLIREYRTRLIADVVTGKLDVRAATTALPEEPADEAGRDESELIAEMENESLEDDNGEEIAFQE
jgi:type I restriction enzyme S subunit